jgi:hypothetical protein
MSNEIEKSLKDKNKDYLKNKQKSFNLRSWDDCPYNFDDLCEEHQKIAKFILQLSKEFNDPKVFEDYIVKSFKLKGEKLIDKLDNPLIRIIEEEGVICSVQGFVTEIENNQIVKYPVVCFTSDVRQYEKVYRRLLSDMKQFFLENSNLIKK